MFLLCCRQLGVCQGYGTRLFDPNLTWGGNPTFAPYSSSTEWDANAPYFVNYRGDTGVTSYTQQGIPCGVLSNMKIPDAGKESLFHFANMMWSKSMMDMLPKTKRPPPRILVCGKETPESSSNVTWTAMMTGNS